MKIENYRATRKLAHEHEYNWVLQLSALPLKKKTAFKWIFSLIRLLQSTLSRNGVALWFHAIFHDFNVCGAKHISKNDDYRIAFQFTYHLEKLETPPLFTMPHIWIFVTFISVFSFLSFHSRVLFVFNCIECVWIVAAFLCVNRIISLSFTRIGDETHICVDCVYRRSWWINCGVFRKNKWDETKRLDFSITHHGLSLGLDIERNRVFCVCMRSRAV